MSNRQKYSPEFRTEAVKLVLEQGLNRDDAAKRLAMPKGTLVRWVAEVRNNKASTISLVTDSCLEYSVVKTTVRSQEPVQQNDSLSL